MPSTLPPAAPSSRRPPPPRPVSPAPEYPAYAHALAGAGGGLATVVLLHPLDTLRTHLQSVGRRASEARRGDALRALRTLYARDGAAALYRGVVPASLGSVLSWGFYFHSFHRVHAELAPALPRYPALAHMLSGTVAGLATALATNPIWVVKVRLQLQRDAAGRGYRPYTGFVDGLRCIAKEEGVRGLYKGIVPSIWLVSHGALQFTMYERFKARLKENEGGPVGARGTSVRHALMASTASKLVASVATYPMQVARTRMQERFADGRMYGRFHTAFLYIFRTEGFRGLYRGLSANIARVTPQAAVTFVTYEQIMRLCQY